MKKLKIKSNIKCRNCINGRVSVCSLILGGKKVELCINCWLGFAYGIKRDLIMYERNEGDFWESVKKTREREKQL